MLLVSAFSTETAEIWCRVALGATVDLDDDDRFSFVCRSAPANAEGRYSETARRDGKNAPACADALGDRTMPDAPAYPLPAFTAYTLPTSCDRVATPWTMAIEYELETRGPPLAERSFARPPPRAPPIL